MREVFKISPETVQVFNRPVDSNLAIHSYSLFIGQPGFGTGAFLVSPLNRVDSQSLIEAAVSGRTAPRQSRAQRGEAESLALSSGKYIGQQSGSGNNGSPSFVFAHVGIWLFR
jgi:hypothetical protein